jgi:hypothetical protein
MNADNTDPREDYYLAQLAALDFSNPDEKPVAVVFRDYQGTATKHLNLTRLSARSIVAKLTAVYGPDILPPPANDIPQARNALAAAFDAIKTALEFFEPFDIYAGVHEATPREAAIKPASRPARRIASYLWPMLPKAGPAQRHTVHGPMSRRGIALFIDQILLT